MVNLFIHRFPAEYATAAALNTALEAMRDEVKGVLAFMDTMGHPPDPSMFEEVEAFRWRVRDLFAILEGGLTRTAFLHNPQDPNAGGVFTVKKLFNELL